MTATLTHILVAAATLWALAATGDPAEPTEDEPYFVGSTYDLHEIFLDAHEANGKGWNGEQAIRACLEWYDSRVVEVTGYLKWDRPYRSKPSALKAPFGIWSRDDILLFDDTRVTYVLDEMYTCVFAEDQRPTICLDSSFFNRRFQRMPAYLVTPQGDTLDKPNRTQVTIRGQFVVDWEKLPHNLRGFPCHISLRNCRILKVTEDSW